MLTVGSLFSGIGGFDLGFERAGMRTVWFCEQDEFCQRVLDKHWPGVPCHPDITRLRGCDVEPVDVLCGGFPCQDISLAGKGAGITGSRSSLWSEYRRLVDELRPRYVVVENVPALKTRGLEVVLTDLMACGYDAEWDCIPASAVGAPHRRDRIWIVAYPQRDQLREQPGRLSGARRADTPLAALDGETWSVADSADGRDGDIPGRGGSAGSGEGDIDANEQRPCWGGLSEVGRESVSDAGRLCAFNGGRQVRPGEWWGVEPDVGRVANGVPQRVDRLRCLGNALVPQIAQLIGERIVAYDR